MSKILYNTKFLQLKEVLSKSGKPWFYAHRPNASDVVVILPIAEDEVLFLIEERPPMSAENKGKYSIAIPAGLVGDERRGETSIDAIKAELLEEAGLVAEKIEIKAVNVASSPGCVSETVTIAFAYVKDKTPAQEPVSDCGVIVDRVWVKIKDIYKWLNDMQSKGYILTGQTLATLFYLYEGEQR